MSANRAAQRAMVRGLATFLKIEVLENGRRVVSDEMRVQKLDDKCLKRVSIPGFTNTQIQELVVTGKTQWRHLGLDYKIKTEEEKLTWGAS